MLDQAEMERFVREDYPRLVHAVALVAGSIDVAEDLVQEATARAWYRATKGETIDSLPNWVAAVAFNLARSRWRRIFLERRTIAPEFVEGPSNEDRVEIQRALAVLPRRQREVAVLRYLLGMSTRDVAATLHVSEGTVKNSLSKARTRLARELRIEEGADDVADR
ncbi:MAG: sigma-70 family RNA polymerase sigma factor [Actinomycetota bacterium]